MARGLRGSGSPCTTRPDSRHAKSIGNQRHARKHHVASSAVPAFATLMFKFVTSSVKCIVVTAVSRMNML